ncbi:hypothetical protein HY623_01420 [Candidatus Uhrbacteria bacterium]|nr:hypothetical protein [Candidatus Uhrbacteria bacterium]
MIEQQRGQTILEIVIALAIFIFISSALASLILGGLHGVAQGSQHLEADALAQEGMEALRSIKNGAWNELSQSPAGVRVSGGEWILSGASDSMPPFTRTITLDAVCRSQAGDIVSCPGSYTDPHTLYGASAVTWTTLEGTRNQVTRSSYLTSWNESAWTQTDWSGGTGQSIWSVENRYDADDGNIDSAVAGQVQLAASAITGTWSLHSQIPEGDDLHDLWTVGGSDIWAVGDDGLIIHWDGTTWTTVTSPHGSRINGIFMLSASSGWAVGDGGKIIRYDGTSWTQVSSPVTDHLNSIWMVSESDGWAVGEAGKILRFDGTSWTQFTDTGGNTWHDIQMISAADGWVVGNQGLIYRWNGSAWSLHTDSGGTVWRSLYLLSATDGWVAGDQGLIYRWNGSEWLLSADTGGTNWRSVYHASSSDGWVTGTGGEIYHWNGVMWSAYSSPTTADINEVRMLSSSLGWAVADGGRLFRYQASAFETSGVVTSSAFSLGDASPVTVIEWDEVVPACTPACDVRLQIRTAPDSGGTPGVFGPWYGATGIDTFFLTPTGSLIPQEANGGSWVQYRAVLDGDGTATPTLNEARVYYK